MGRRPTTTTITALVSDPAHPQTLYASSADGVFKSDDAGDSWQTVTNGLSDRKIAAIALHPTQPVRVYAVTVNGTVFRSPDGAASWQRRGQVPSE